eukprot:6769711-Ditylum_brightwellii.AAC.1
MKGDYIMTAICAYAIPVLQYTFDIMKWMKGELRKLDIKIQKMLTVKGVHHLKGNIHHLYLHRSKGKRGLVGVEDTHNYSAQNNHTDAEIPPQICFISKVYHPRVDRWHPPPMPEREASPW